MSAWRMKSHGQLGIDRPALKQPRVGPRPEGRLLRSGPAMTQISGGWFCMFDLWHAAGQADYAKCLHVSELGKVIQTVYAPVFAYVAGTSAHFNANDHVWRAGETAERLLVAFSDTRSYAAACPAAHATGLAGPRRAGRPCLDRQGPFPYISFDPYNRSSFFRRNRMKVKPLGGGFLIKIQESESKTASGIIIPQTAQEKTQNGVVIAV